VYEGAEAIGGEEKGQIWAAERAAPFFLMGVSAGAGGNLREIAAGGYPYRWQGRCSTMTAPPPARA
jgi:hypothetical protein